MSSDPDVLVAALLRVGEANRNLRLILADNETMLTDAVSSLNEGATVAGLLDRLPVMKGQTRSDQAVAMLFDARQHLRRIIVALALDEGVSVETLASQLGVRPDLVQTYAAERPRTS